MHGLYRCYGCEDSEVFPPFVVACPGAVSPRPKHEVFPSDFIVTLRGLVGIHQSIYPLTPPQGIYFEALVEEAFRPDATSTYWTS